MAVPGKAVRSPETYPQGPRGLHKNPHTSTKVRGVCNRRKGSTGPLWPVPSSQYIPRLFCLCTGPGGGGGRTGQRLCFQTHKHMEILGTQYVSRPVDLLRTGTEGGCRGGNTRSGSGSSGKPSLGASGPRCRMWWCPIVGPAPHVLLSFTLFPFLVPGPFTEVRVGGWLPPFAAPPQGPNVQISRGLRQVWA